MGGEEFAVLLPSTDLSMAAEIAERIRRNVEAEREHIDGKLITYTVSIGAALFEQHMRVTDDLIAAADEAMYAAKRAGRNRVSVKEAKGI